MHESANVLVYVFSTLFFKTTGPTYLRAAFTYYSFQALVELGIENMDENSGEERLDRKLH